MAHGIDFFVPQVVEHGVMVSPWPIKIFCMMSFRSGIRNVLLPIYSALPVPAHPFSRPVQSGICQKKVKNLWEKVNFAFPKF